MRAFLSRPPTDWNEIYLTLVCSDMHDPRFHADSFGQQPTRHVYRALEFTLERERERTNAQSVSTARLGQVVQVAASMGKAKAKMADFLPYEMKRPSKEPRISAEAALTIRKLIKTRELPLSVAAMLVDDLKNADPLI